MPVIINDFEVIVEPTTRREGGSTREAEPLRGSEQILQPEDIEQIIRHYIERYRRLLAD
jgi:hypothetical protein